MCTSNHLSFRYQTVPVSNKFSLVILDNPRLKEEYESKIVNGVEDVDDASQSTDMWVSQIYSCIIYDYNMFACVAT